MASTILNRNQVPLAIAYKDVQSVFTVLPQVPLLPLVDADAASKKYVDDALAGAVTASATGLDVKQSVRAATVGTAGTYTATTGAKARGQITAAPNTLDGVTLVGGNRILVKNHTTGAANGIYVVTTVGAGATGVWDRAADFDDDAEVTANAFTFIEEGATQADTAWVVTTNDSITVGGAAGTAIVWNQFAGNGAVTLENIAGGPLTVTKGGTGGSSFTSGGLLRGNGTGPLSVATPADIVNALGSTPVNNAIAATSALTATNATNTTNVAVTNDNAPVTPVFLSWVAGSSGNQPIRVTSAALTFIPSTGVLSATGFSGNGSALTSLTAANLLGTIPAAVLGNSTFFIGTTSIALNRASANQTLTGILSIVFPGSTSGTVTLAPSAVAGATTLTMPATSGILITSGDTGTVTNTMLSGSIADSKLLQITTSGKVSAGAVTGTLFTLGTTAIVALSTVSTVAGMVSITSVSFVGALTGNASTASALNNAVTFNNSGTGVASGTTFDGSATRTISWNTIGAQAAISSNNYVTKQIIAFTGNTVYTIPSTLVLGTEMVFLNGVLQHPLAGNDYTISGSVITFLFTPAATDVVSVTYFK